VWVTAPELDVAQGGNGKRGGEGGASSEEQNIVRGYSVRDLWRDDLSTKEGVQRYVKWQNWIHRRGLGPCLEDFRADIVTLVEWDKEEEKAGEELQKRIAKKFGELGVVEKDKDSSDERR